MKIGNQNIEKIKVFNDDELVMTITDDECMCKNGYNMQFSCEGIEAKNSLEKQVEKIIAKLIQSQEVVLR